MRDYESIIQQTDTAFQSWIVNLHDDIIINGRICFYSRKSITERNEVNEMESYLPNHILIGDDSGDMVFLLEASKDSPVLRADAGALFVDDLEKISSSFSSWQGSNFSLPIEEEYHLPLHAEIHIDQVDDLKTMFTLKNFLSLNWSASQMKQLLEQQPFLAVQKGTPIAIEQRFIRNPELQKLKKYIFYAEDKKLKQLCS